MTQSVTNIGSGINRFLSIIFATIAFLGNLTLFLMFVVMAIEVALRSLNLGTLRIADEMSAALLVGATFLGLSVAIREGVLFRFDGIVNRLPGKVGQVYERLLYFIALITSVTLAWYLIVFVHSSWKRGTVSDGMVDYPLWIPQILMPLGMIAVVFAVLEKLLSPDIEPAETLHNV